MNGQFSTASWFTSLFSKGNIDPGQSMSKTDIQTRLLLCWLDYSTTGVKRINSSCEVAQTASLEQRPVTYNPLCKARITSIRLGEPFQENQNPLVSVVRSVLLEKIPQMQVVLSVREILTFHKAYCPALVQVMQDCGGGFFATVTTPANVMVSLERLRDWETEPHWRLTEKLSCLWCSFVCDEGQSHIILPVCVNLCYLTVLSTISAHFRVVTTFFPSCLLLQNWEVHGMTGKEKTCVSTHVRCTG